MRTLSACVVGLLSAACVPEYAATNPYDPETPPAQQAPAVLSGRIVPEGPIDLTQAAVFAEGRGELARPDASGLFRVELTPASYALSVQAPNHEELTVGSLTLGVGETRDLGSLTLRAFRGDIAGRVLLRGQSDHSGTVVSLRPGNSLTLSDSAGNYAFTGVPVATGYTLVFLHDRFASKLLTADVARDLTTTLTDVELVTATGDFSINGGVPFTNDPDVTLELFGFSYTDIEVSENQNFTNAVWEPFDDVAGTHPYTLSPSDALKTVYVRFSDDGGATVTDPMVSAITLDMTAPPLADFRIEDGRAAVNTPDVTLSLVAWDALSGIREMRVSIDGTLDNEPWEPFAPFRSAQVANPTIDQLKTIAVEFRDAALNPSAPVTRTVFLDTLEPQVSGAAIQLNNNDQYTTTPIVTLLFGVTGADFVRVGDESSLAGRAYGPYPLNDELTYALPAGDGPKTVWASFADQAGNETTIFFDDIELDATRPTSPVVLINNGVEFTNDPNLSLSLSVAGATFMRVSSDPTFAGATWVANGPAASLRLDRSGPVPDGLYNVYAVFRDDAGNESEVAHDRVALDRVGPQNAGVSINSGAPFTRSVSVTVALNADGADEMRVTSGVITSEPWVSFAKTAVVLLPAGDCGAGQLDCKVVQAQFRDRAGNETSPMSEDRITLDGAPPSTPIIVSPAMVTRSSSATVEIAAQSTDSFFLRYEVAGGPTCYPSGFTPITLAGATPPTFNVCLDQKVGDSQPSTAFFENTIRLRAVDQAGNVSDESAVVITRDTVAPATPIIGSAAAVVNGDFFSVFLDATSKSHDDATFANYEIQGGTFATWTPTTLTDGLTFGLRQGDGSGCLPVASTIPCVNTLEVRAIDQAGNVSGSDSVVIQEDSVPPSLPGVIPTEAVVNVDPTDTVHIVVETPAVDATAVTYEVRGPSFDFSDIGPPPFDVQLLEDQVNEFRIRGRDAAGNVGIEAVVNITETSSQLVNSRSVDMNNPDVSGDRVVYDRLDEDTGLLEVFVYDLRTNVETQVSTIAGNDERPRISGRIAVWQNEGAPANFEVYFDDLNTAPGPSNLGSPGIMDRNADTDGNFAVFQEGGGLCGVAANVYTTLRWRDLNTGGSGTVPLPGAGWQWTSCPRMACGRIAVTARPSAGASNDVFLYKMGSALTQVTFNASDGNVSQTDPVLGCDYMAWRETGNNIGFSVVQPPTRTVRTLAPCISSIGDVSGANLTFMCQPGATETRDIYVHDLSTNLTRSIFPYPGEQESPAIDDKRVVWRDKRVGTYGIFRYDLVTTKWLALGPRADTSPDIEGTAIAYFSFSAGASTLSAYNLLTDVESVLTTPVSPSRVNRMGIGMGGGTARVAWVQSGGTPPGLYFSTLGGGATAVTTAGGMDGPDMSGSTLVWDQANGAVDDIKYQVVGGSIQQLATATNLRSAPRIDTDVVAWLDFGATVNDYRILCCQATAFPCTPQIVSVSSTDVKASPTVTKDRRSTEYPGQGMVVWENTTLGSIEGIYVLPDCSVAGTPSAPVLRSGSLPGVGRRPRANNRYVVWEDSRFGNWDIFLYDLVTNTEFQVTDDPANQINASIYGNTILWEDYRFGNPDIYFHQR